MKTNDQLRDDVVKELEWEPSVTTSNITVTTDKGVVTLRGSVPYYAEKGSAEKAVQRVAGVKAIAEELDVNPSGVNERDDTEIAKAVVNCLKWHVWVPSKVQAIVEKGFVTLTGNVTWEYQRNSAADAIEYLPGVKGVFNNISLESDVKVTMVKDAIEKALKRNAEIDAKNIKVSAEGGKVTLTGTAETWSERQEAGSAAWGTPGVVEVNNALVVSI